MLRSLNIPEAEASATEETVLHRELQGLLHEAVNHLPGQQQKVYELSRSAGLSHEEIAQQLNISKETVKKHLMAAVKGMQEYISRRNSAISVLAVLLTTIDT